MKNKAPKTPPLSETHYKEYNEGWLVALNNDRFSERPYQNWPTYDEGRPLAWLAGYDDYVRIWPNFK